MRLGENSSCFNLFIRVLQQGFSSKSVIRIRREYILHWPLQNYANEVRYSLLFVYQRRYKMATEVYNWVQKYDADLDGRQVRKPSLK